MELIDCHCHAGNGSKLTDPWNTTAPLRNYLRRARSVGIDKTVVFPVFHADYARANAELARIVAQLPDRLIGFAFVHPQHDQGRIFKMIQQAVNSWGFRGIKVHGKDGLPTREVCEVAEAFQIPLLVDVIGKTSVIEMLATAFPRVDFIIPHLGSFIGDWRAHQQLIDQLVRFPNVYTDTSGVFRFDYIVAAVRRAGASKVLFGSDGPWLHPAIELFKIRLLRLPTEQEALILGGNITKLLKKIVRGSFRWEYSRKKRKLYCDSKIADNEYSR